MKLKVLVDNNEYGLWNFSNNETLYIPTFNPESFENDSIVNMDVGLHNISFIFNFKYFSHYTVNRLFDMNSTLNFQINNDYFSPIQSNNYTYNSTINILKKEKTIHIVKFNYYNLCEHGEYEIHRDYIKKYCLDYGVIISDDKEVIFKDKFFLTDNVVKDGLDYIYYPGSYNFTVVNLDDGTKDSIMFKALKYKPKLNIKHIINESNITFQITTVLGHEGFCYITVDNITKESWANYYGPIDNVTFENLSSGIHTMSLYCEEYSEAESFFYEMTFEIENTHNNSYEDNNTLINQNNTLNNNTPINMTFIKGDGTFNATNPLDGNGKHNFVKNLNSKKKNNVKSEKKVEISTFGDIKSADLSDELSTQKSYEIIEKSTLNSENILIKIILLILMLISLMIGYFKFKK